MNKNKKIIICVAVVALVLLAVGLIYFLGRDKTENAPETPAVQEQSAETEKTAEPEGITATEPQPEEKTAEGTQTESAQLIENEGEVTIIVPEGEESDGF